MLHKMETFNDELEKRKSMAISFGDMIHFNEDTTEVTIGPGKFEFTVPVKFGVLPDTEILGIICKPLNELEEVSEDELDAVILADEVEDDLEDDDEEDEAEMPPPNA